MESFRRGIRIFRSQDVEIESRPSFLDKAYPMKIGKHMFLIFSIGDVFLNKLGLDAGIGSWDLKNRIPREKLRI